MDATSSSRRLNSRIKLSTRFDLWIEACEIGTLSPGDVAEFVLGCGDQVWGKVQWPCPEAPVTIRMSAVGQEARIHATSLDPSETWTLRLRGNEDEPVITAVEMSHLQAEPWTIQFSGGTVHTHQGQSLKSQPIDGFRLRLGAFTQHGQLFNLRDWVMVEEAQMCCGLIAIKPGSWARPDVNVLTAHGTDGCLEIDMPRPAGRITRTYLLAYLPATQAIGLVREGIAYYEPEAGFAVWPASMIARYGYTRKEKIAGIEGMVPTDTPPASFPFGSADDLRRMLAQCRQTPELAGGHPFWLGDFDAARDEMLKVLRFAVRALRCAAYLHPWGNPVALRTVAPNMAVYAMLDTLGQLSPVQRHEGTELIAVLAALLFSRDFYPHQVATIPAGSPGSVQGIYAGMLNQNFNTDRYVAVGMAGCFLSWHPHARRWLGHAMDQLEKQLTAYLYPGGAWEESHTYANHVKLCLLPLVVAAKNQPGGRDWTIDPRFREFCRFFVQILSPRDAVLGGHRGVPAIGDHGYRHQEHTTFYGGSFLFLWMASVMKEDRELFLWAWRESGGRITDPPHEQALVFTPLMLPEFAPLIKSAIPEPKLPEMAVLPGYGAYCRRDQATPEESLLLVRCGDSWGHYQSDQGSFWWWQNGRLVCADSDLGAGDLKFRQAGHNLVGYPGRELLQYLHHHPYPIERCEKLPDGSQQIQCRVRGRAWFLGSPGIRHEPILYAEQPEVVRCFTWLADGRLRIVDDAVRSPEGVVAWYLNVPAEHATGDWANRKVIFDLPDGERLILTLPQTPLATELRRLESTWHLACRYPEGKLIHELSHHLMPGKPSNGH